MKVNKHTITNLKCSIVLRDTHTQTQREKKNYGSKKEIIESKY